MKSKLCFSILLFWLIASIVIPVFTNIDIVMDNSKYLQSPSWEYFLGSDKFGRSQIVKVFWGARSSLIVSIIAASVSLLLSLLLASIAAWNEKFIDSIIMRGIDLFQSVPALVIMSFIFMLFNSEAIALGEYSSHFSMVLGLSVLGINRMTRVIRTEILSEKRKEYVEAATAFGASSSRILIFHILPNIKGAILITFVYLIPTNILLESFLSFIGVGIQEPNTSWGILMNEAWLSFSTYQYLSIAPIFALSTIMYSLYHIAKITSTNYKNKFVN